MKKKKEEGVSADGEGGVWRVNEEEEGGDA